MDAVKDALTFLLIQERLWGRSGPQIDLLLRNLDKVGSDNGTETKGNGDPQRAAYRKRRAK